MHELPSNQIKDYIHSDSIIEKRILKEKEFLSENKEYIQTIISNIKNNKEGISLRVKQLAKKYNLKILDSYKFAHIIKRNTNFILHQRAEYSASKTYIDIKFVENISREEIIDNRLPIYKFDSSPDNNFIKEILMENTSINVDDFLSIYRYLLKSKCGEKWVNLFLTANIIIRSFVDTNKALDILQLLMDKKLLIVLQTNTTYFRLTNNDKDIQKFIDEFYANNNEDNEKKMVTTENQSNDDLNDKNKIDSTVSNLNIPTTDNDNVTANDKVSNNIDNDPNHEFNILKSNINNYFSMLHNQVNSCLQQQRQELNQGFTVVDKLIEENNRINDELKKQQQIIIELQAQNKKLDDYYYELSNHAAEVLEILMGQLSNILDQFSMLPRHKINQEYSVTRIKGKMLNTIGQSVNEITNFIEEKKDIPNEIK
ncbi:hypothetical protein DWZ11_01145 [Megamonas rupellensis]|uniref:Uncharacterized protein n=1 Tax=Megamonas rupellensis TaxID=491921 RepID=A0A412A0B1_9FIRM|nr:hypothetical protein [Megamonas rupellensis]RGQ08494.1 hypothetical protein DWZ11_01145 [Megamonas rupellensis]